MSYSRISEALQNEGNILEMTVGYSMSPMLKNRQNPIVLEKVTKKPEKHDVVLYIDGLGRHVLHRVVKVGDDGFTIRGDNCSATEYGIKEDQIIAVLKGYYKDDVYIDCGSDPKYLRYVSRLWARYPYCVVRDFIKKVIRKLKKTASRA